MTPIFGTTRPAFLILTPACVALGLAAAHLGGTELAPLPVALILTGAVAAHVAVNALNEYFDFRCGLDAETIRTPFSGGSGTLPAHPELAPLALALGLCAAGLTLAVGLYFLAAGGWALLPAGLIGMVLVLAYTPWLTRRPWLCLIAPGLGFGPCMVLGAEAALSGRYSWAGLAASLVPFFLVNNLLLLNQFPDLEADRRAGRGHLPILLGRRGGARIYCGFFAAAALALLTAPALGLLPAGSLLGLPGLLVGLPVLRALARHADDPPALLPAMGLNVAVSVATPALMALGAFLG